MEPGRSADIGAEPDLKKIVRAVLDGYRLQRRGLHGLGHWARVLENGLRLAEKTGADARIVRLFAVLHDSRRENDATDDGHGRRGAEFAASLRPTLLELADPDFEILQFACAHHTDTDFNPDLTIQTCWDADRLDLGRVGKKVDPDFLGRAAGGDGTLLRWADERARRGVVPAFVNKDWIPER